MDPRILPILQTYEACAAEMRQHCEWMEGMLTQFGRYMAYSGEITANMASISATREHARTLEAAAQRIEREWIQPGDHSYWCGRAGGPVVRPCVQWCMRDHVRAPVEPPPVTVRVSYELPAPAPEPQPAPAPKPEEPKQDRFALIELE